MTQDTTTVIEILSEVSISSYKYHAKIYFVLVQANKYRFNSISEPRIGRVNSRLDDTSPQYCRHLATVLRTAAKLFRVSTFNNVATIKDFVESA